jgi:hypothetical protein
MLLFLSLGRNPVSSFLGEDSTKNRVDLFRPRAGIRRSIPDLTPDLFVPGILIVSENEDGVYMGSKRKSWQAKGEKNKFITERNSDHLFREQSSPIRQPEVARGDPGGYQTRMHGNDSRKCGDDCFMSIGQTSPSIARAGGA